MRLLKPRSFSFYHFAAFFCTLFAFFVVNLCCPELSMCHLCSAFMHFILPAETMLNASAARRI